MLTTHAVGIDLGTTYSCIAYLNKEGQPVTLPNQEGELSTPSVVLFDDDEVIVGTEALRNSILHPDRVVQHAKRFMGDASKRWTINGKPYTPVDISTFILKKLIGAAQEQIGVIEQAVITVPAQFSDAQRHATVEAGHRAGLQRVDIINEPVAAALCHVLGTEGMWFDELARDQQIMVFDLGGGTFDLSLVKYAKNEVSVIASSGDLQLGGLDWNQALLKAIADQFTKEFSKDPRNDPQSLQALALEVEQTKRSLSVRPKAALTCQHDGMRKTYQVEQAQFEKITRPLVDRTADITKRMLKDNKMGWAHVDVVLTTGGASRMPMVRETLKKMSGTTLNTSLSPDLSIAHGATYYAGMLLTNTPFARSILNEKAVERLSRVRQQSVNARALGILVRDTQSNMRVPHYLIPANTPLPAENTQVFGTVVPNQRRVNLQIVESGITPEHPHARLGACVIEDLPPHLPEGSEIAVTISYDTQACVHVSAKDMASGKQATVEIVRAQNVAPQLASDQGRDEEAALIESPQARKTPSATKSLPSGGARPPSGPSSEPTRASTGGATPPARPSQTPTARPTPANAAARAKLEAADRPVPLCNECGEPLGPRGKCEKCGATAAPRTAARRPAAPQPAVAARKPGSPPPAARPTPRAAAQPAAAKPAPRAPLPPLPADDEILDLSQSGTRKPVPRPAPQKSPGTTLPPGKNAPRKPADAGEDEFWQLAE